MQYFKPENPIHFVGDAMPFWSQGRYHLFYLIDQDHHAGLGGFGGHEWGHASTTNLIHWEHHPLALELGPAGTCDDLSVCTGSLLEHEGRYYAFYAGRSRDPEYGKIETVCVATSDDCVHFTKSPDNPIIVPNSDYVRVDFRDPNVFRDDNGIFHMLVTTQLVDAPVANRGDCLAHLVSEDLQQWEFVEPFLQPGVNVYPECADYFRWGQWYYVTFLAASGICRYRMSRQPFGPWLRPPVDALEGPWLAAMKTAAFGENRRIGVGFLPWRDGGRDDGGWQYAGNAIFREIIQNADGTLSTKFPAEMMPAGVEALGLSPAAMTGEMQIASANTVHLRNEAGLAMAVCDNIPPDARIRMQISPQAHEFGLVVRGSGRCEGGYEIRFTPHERRVRVKPLAAWENVSQSVFGVEGLDQPFSVDLVMKGDILDLCVDERVCFVNRYGDQRGGQLFMFAENGTVDFDAIDVRPLAN